MISDIFWNVNPVKRYTTIQYQHTTLISTYRTLISTRWLVINGNMQLTGYSYF